MHSWGKVGCIGCITGIFLQFITGRLILNIEENNPLYLLLISSLFTFITCCATSWKFVDKTTFEVIIFYQKKKIIFLILICFRYYGDRTYWEFC